MHELAITEGIINIINSEAEKQSFTSVQEITLSVGEFSGLVPQCILEFFPLAAAGTIAENAKIVINTIHGEFKCSDCGYEGAIDRSNACCPECGSLSIKMTKGREFYVENLKVE